MSGVTSRPTSAGASAAVNQVTHGDAMATPSSDASFMHSRFCAAAVRKSALECTEPWNCACTRNLPRRPALGESARSRASLGHCATVYQALELRLHQEPPLAPRARRVCALTCRLSCLGHRVRAEPWKCACTGTCPGARALGVPARSRACVLPINRYTNTHAQQSVAR